ncbi:MAG: anaerobic ribonucleoside-triphosphate reductase, partial [Actinomycetota bacterium]
MSSVEAKTINVIKNSSNKGDATDIALMVSTSSKAEINPWDKSKIVNSLVIETGATTDLSEEIADAVEQKILDSNLKNVTTSIIRELIDIELLERDLPMMHKRHSHLGLPMYDVEQIIFNANKENSNTTHNPESINLTLAEALLKEYALRKVFSEDVSQAHMIGDIHLHDLGFIVRPYTYMGDSVVLAKKKGNFEKLISIKQFYDGLPFEFQTEDGVWIKQPISDLYILDRDGKWTKVIQLTKKQKKNKRMYFVRTSDGKQQVVTDDHPMITTEGIKPCEL